MLVHEKPGTIIITQQVKRSPLIDIHVLKILHVLKHIPSIPILVDILSHRPVFIKPDVVAVIGASLTCLPLACPWSCVPSLPHSSLACACSPRGRPLFIAHTRRRTASTASKVASFVSLCKLAATNGSLAYGRAHRALAN